ncbi:enoyl-CoA hydratase/isomerase family protein [Sinosporangium siamense]|uniref:Enoyl-CoA hydratase n=1 Tax=Sinosporangium siamense TaxID=1367973 RepID=A0A919RET2_9ACTN|nr:enoyl-CoA hydratase-related protein [Sinosporangium siamense]GII92067.1 enoyl-CoA hydratase [Sinosporangium siamense]
MGDLVVERSGRVGVVRFDRPAKLNAFTSAMLADLAAALAELANDPRTSALVLTGTGRAFSAGIDLAEVAADLAGGDPAAQRARVAALQDLTRTLSVYPKPVISAVNGLAVGVGAELAIASDLRIAAESASFAFMEARRGLFPTNGVLYYLPRLVGHGRAMDLLLSGDPLTAADALTAGLVSRVLPEGDLLAHAVHLGETIAGAAPISVDLIRRAARRVWEMDLAQVLETETEGMLACLGSTDLVEGVTAFAARRTPDFD